MKWPFSKQPEPPENVRVKTRGECQMCHREQDVVNGVVASHVSPLGVAIGTMVCLGTGHYPKTRQSFGFKKDKDA